MLCEARTGGSLRKYLAWALWCITTALALLAVGISIPLSYARHATLCAVGPCISDQLSPEGLQALQNAGLSTRFYAAYNVGLMAAMALIYVAVAAIIFWRRPDDRMALFTSLTLVVFGTFATTLTEPLAAQSSIWNSLIDIATSLAWVGFPIFLYLFPDGRFVPRWTRVPAALWVAVQVPYFLRLDTVNPGNWPVAVQGLLYTGLFATGIYAQVYRYRHVSTWRQRQQTKWVLLGLIAAVVATIVALYVLPVALPPLAQSGTLADLAVDTATFLAAVMIPIAIGFSMLRYRLWDIDLLINRTLVYGPLSAILVGMYSASTSLFQKLWISSTGDTSDATAVLTTLVLVSTFTPIKGRLQLLVDRHFKEVPEPGRRLRDYAAHVQSVLEVIDPECMTRRLLDEAVAAFGAVSGVVYWGSGQPWQVVHTVGEWDGDDHLSAPLESGGLALGHIALGARADGASYTTQDGLLLRQTAELVANAAARGWTPASAVPLPASSRV
jgi:hypothetical protein